MLVRIERLKYPHKYKEAGEALWRAISTVGHNVTDVLISDLKKQPIVVDISSRKFSLDRVAEFTKLFDFSIVDVADGALAEPVPTESGTLKLYTVTVKVAFTARNPVNIHTSLILASDKDVAQDKVLTALDLEPDEAIYGISVVEIEGPFYDGQVLTLNSKK